MSRGILQLAATGRLPLHLEYRMLTTPLSGSHAETETSEAVDPSNTSFMPDAFELIYWEY
jgi:hypothetical protein